MQSLGFVVMPDSLGDGRRKAGRGSLGYLCLQATREGQASHAHVNEIVKGLRQLGWEVDLHQPEYAESSEAPGGWIRLWEFCRVQLKFVRKLGQWDAIYVRSHVAALPSVAVARVLGVKIIREVNGTWKDMLIAWPWTRKLAWLIRWATRIQIRWSDLIITTTTHMVDWVREQGGGDEVYVVRNGADVELFRPDASTEYDLPRPYALFFGALAPWQGVETIVEATEHACWPDCVSLVIAGDGALREFVENATFSERAVVYLGKVPFRKMPGVIAGSLCGLSPQNRGEGRSELGFYPLKLFETMSCGVPVVVTDFPGQADLVSSEGCGLVIPPEDPSALARAVTLVAEDPGLARAMGARGRRSAVQEHSWFQRAKETDDLLMRCLQLE